MKTKSKRIVGVSDVSLGYGSPQIPAFMSSLVDYYKEAEGIIIEPDQLEKKPRHDQFVKFAIKRLHSIFPPHSIPGKIEYNRMAAKEVNRLRPEILIIHSEYSLPVLLELTYRPRFVIYYALELVSYTSTIEIARDVASTIDLAIYPEENRATKDSQQCRFNQVQKVIIYNSADSVSHHKTIVPATERNGKILYNGTIEKDRTFAEYFLRREIQSVPIDIFGLVDGLEKKETKDQLSKLSGAITYYGYINAEELAQLRGHYSYNIVMWNPSREDQLYASPNKFFESIASGVPPIAAPHPQCKMIINRYKCGVLMDDWSFDSFYDAIQKARKAYGTKQYTTMVENCQKAFVRELNWEKQFEKVKPFLKALE